MWGSRSQWSQLYQMVEQRRKLPAMVNDRALFTRAAPFNDKEDPFYHSPSSRIGNNFSPTAALAASILFEEFPAVGSRPCVLIDSDAQHVAHGISWACMRSNCTTACCFILSCGICHTPCIGSGVPCRIAECHHTTGLKLVQPCACHSGIHWQHAIQFNSFPVLGSKRSSRPWPHSTERGQVHAHHQLADQPAPHSPASHGLNTCEHV